jgi:cell division septal protein FtsQ
MSYRPKPPGYNRTRFDVAIRQRQAAHAGVLRISSRVRALVVAVALLGAAVLAGVMWFTGEAWRVQTISVRNNTTVPIDRIVAASGLQGEHTQWADLNAAAQRIDDLPGVEAVRIICEWHGACEIAIKETQPVSVWHHGTHKVWVDDEDKVQQVLGAAGAGINAPLQIRVESGALPSTEKPLDVWLVRALNELQVLQPDVRQYIYSESYGFMFTNARGWRVRLGISEYNGAMRDKLELMRKLEAMLVAQQVNVRVLDVRFPQAPFYVR